MKVVVVVCLGRGVCSWFLAGLWSSGVPFEWRMSRRRREEEMQGTRGGVEGTGD